MSEFTDIAIKIAKIETLLSENLPGIKASINGMQKDIEEINLKLATHKEFCGSVVAASGRRFDKLEGLSEAVMDISHIVSENEKFIKKQTASNEFIKKESKKTLIGIIGTLILTSVLAVWSWAAGIISIGGKGP